MEVEKVNLIVLVNHVQCGANKQAEWQARGSFGLTFGLLARPTFIFSSVSKN